jgi:hypothetical protein
MFISDAAPRPQAAGHGLQEEVRLLDPGSAGLVSGVRRYLEE